MFKNLFISFNLRQLKNIRKLSSVNNQFILRSKVKPINIKNNLLHEHIWSNLSQNENKIAVVSYETGYKYTYGDLFKKCGSLSYFLRQTIKLNFGDTIGVILPNVPEYPIVLLGGSQAGLKISTYNPSYTIDEIKKQLINSEAKLLITINELIPKIKQISENIPIITVSKDNIYNEIHFNEIIQLDNEFIEKKVSSDDVVFLPYSSGTTGMPKGVELTHRNIVSNLNQIRAPEFVDQISNEDIVPGFLPFFHIYGLVIISLHTLDMGNKLITTQTFNTDILMNILKKYKPTIIYGVPLMANLITNNDNIKLEDLESLRLLTSGAAPLGKQDIERFVNKTKGKINLLQAYGMTETSPVTLLQTVQLENGKTAGGSGLLLPNTEAKIISTVNNSLDCLSANQPGELIVRGPQIMKGYFKNPKANEEIFLEDNWMRTGDIAYYDKNEHFYITDRLKELIKVKGFQVAPAELEEILRDHPSIENASVIGIPHESYGEIPKAFVVLKPNSKVTPEEIQKYVANKVSDYKHLTGGVVFIDNLPKSASGKILKRNLKNL